MTLTEIAKNTARHLSRMGEDKALPDNGHLPTLYNAYAWCAGNRVKIRYKSFWTPCSLTREGAEAYLAWLDAGNSGTHYDCMRSLLKA
jgi:hypothetical protein